MFKWGFIESFFLVVILNYIFLGRGSYVVILIGWGKNDNIFRDKINGVFENIIIGIFINRSGRIWEEALSYMGIFENDFLSGIVFLCLLFWIIIEVGEGWGYLGILFWRK